MRVENWALLWIPGRFQARPKCVRFHGRSSGGAEIFGRRVTGKSEVRIKKRVIPVGEVGKVEICHKWLV